MNGDADNSCIYLKGFARPKCFFLIFFFLKFYRVSPQFGLCKIWINESRLKCQSRWGAPAYWNGANTRRVTASRPAKALKKQTHTHRKDLRPAACYQVCCTIHTHTSSNFLLLLYPPLTSLLMRMQVCRVQTASSELSVVAERKWLIWRFVGTLKLRLCCVLRWLVQ